MGKKSAPAIPPPPPLPQLPPIQAVAPNLPLRQLPEEIQLPDSKVPEGLTAPTAEEIALKAKENKLYLRNRVGGPRGTKFTAPLLSDDPDEENLKKPLIY